MSDIAQQTKLEEYEEWCERHDLPKHLSKSAFDDAYSLGRAPLLSTIAQQGEALVEIGEAYKALMTEIGSLRLIVSQQSEALEAIKASAKFMRDNAEHIGDEDFEGYSQKIMDSVDAIISQKVEG